MSKRARESLHEEEDEETTSEPSGSGTEPQKSKKQAKTNLPPKNSTETVAKNNAPQTEPQSAQSLHQPPLPSQNPTQPRPSSGVVISTATSTTQPTPTTPCPYTVSDVLRHIQSQQQQQRQQQPQQQTDLSTRQPTLHSPSAQPRATDATAPLPTVQQSLPRSQFDSHIAPFAAVPIQYSIAPHACLMTPSIGAVITSVDALFLMEVLAKSMECAHALKIYIDSLEVGIKFLTNTQDQTLAKIKSVFETAQRSAISTANTFNSIGRNLNACRPNGGASVTSAQPNGTVAPEARTGNRTA